MKLIVGLGNPGKKYETTKHNIGFMCIDYLSDYLKQSGCTVDFKKKFESEFAKVTYQGNAFILLKPQTYMNLSGKAVKQVLDYFDIKREDVLVVFDDMDLVVGKVKIKPKGSSGGQKGMQNIIDQLKTQTLSRIKIGIGRPKDDTVDHVLSHFSKSEKKLIEPAIELSAKACLMYVESDIEKTMTTYNGVL